MCKETNCQKCFHYNICEKADDHFGVEECENEAPIADIEPALKTTEIKRQKKWIAYLKNQIAAKEEKVKGHEEIAKVHSAYIAILLKKLGATDSNNAITIPKGEVVEALEHYEARATIDTIDNSWKLYCEVIE